ncbi:MAG: biopolymer transporter ExbB [Rhodobacteraceae bacterium]|nr:biopolymer transporter ExbB [Paracoccaceae bacterium]
MARLDFEFTGNFSLPVRQIIMMLTVLGLSGFGAFVALPSVMPVFEANPYLNGFIMFVFVLGVLATFYQVAQSFFSVRWIQRFTTGESDTYQPTTLLAPLASLLRSRGAKSQLSSTSTRSILDSVATRIDEQREITRYIVNLLIFLGLLGTFYGLATTVPAVVDTIRSLAPQDGEQGVDVFNRLMTGLEAQLGGMGVAFASSLLGLAGSLIVGLLELLAGHGQNRFYRELEEWLSSITRVGFAGGEEGGEGTGIMGAALDQMAEQLDTLRGIIAASEASRAMTDEKMGALLDTMAVMAERMEERDQASVALSQMAAGQAELIDLLRSREVAEPIDAESRMRLRSIDVQLLRVLEEISAGRQESMAELRKELDVLVRSLSRPRPGAARVTARPVPPSGDGG